MKVCKICLNELTVDEEDNLFSYIHPSLDVCSTCLSSLKIVFKTFSFLGVEATYIYEYDDTGNITSKKTYTLTAVGVTPSLILSSVTYGYNDEYEWGDLLTSYGNVTINYDEIGNPLSYYNGKSYTFTWKNGRQLATAAVNGDTLSFNYNDEGIRTSKTVNGVVHTYHLSGADIIAEEWGNNLIVYLYDANGAPMGICYKRNFSEFYDCKSCGET